MMRCARCLPGEAQHCSWCEEGGFKMITPLTKHTSDTNFDDLGWTRPMWVVVSGVISLIDNHITQSPDKTNM